MKHAFKRYGILILVLLALVICLAGQAFAANPFMEQWERIPDGEPRVFTDPETGTQRMYVYGSHDTQSGGYCGPDHVVWSAPVDDLTNWRHDGTAFNISWLNGLTFTPEGGSQMTYNASGVLYAPDVVYHPQLNKYYMFVFTASGHYIFVAESDTPTGPFTNPRYVGQGFDPAVLVDDVKDANGNQRVYLYWSIESERSCYACELDPLTMQKIDGTLHVPVDHSSAVNDNDTMPHRRLDPFYFFEGPSIRKVGDTYVLSYAKTDAGSGNGKLAEIGYCFSDNPYGDPKLGTAWEFGGTIVDNLGEVIKNPYAPNVTTTTYKGGNNHGGMIEVNGQWYQIYHRATGVSIMRQAMAEAIDLYFDEDGKLVIEQAEITSQGFETNGLNPYESQYAASACFGLGSYTFDCNPSRNFDPQAERADWYPVTNLKNQSWLGYKYFNFGDGVDDGMGLSLVLSLKEYAAGTVNVYAADAKEKYTDPEQPRTLIGSTTLAGGNSTEHTVEIPVQKLDGTKAIYLEFRSTSGSTVCELNKLWFVESEAAYADTICLDGVEIENFSPFTYGYTVKLEATDELPEVTAQAADGLTVSITQATAENPVAVVKVASENKTNTYTITFKKLVLPSSWDFTKTDKETLLSKWEIVNPSSDSSTWSIDENGLHLAVLPGDLYQTTNSAQNVFTLNSPGNWIMDTKVSFNKAPSQLYHQAVIMAFQDVDNYVKLSYEYGVHTMGDGAQKSYVQFAKETGAKMTQSFQDPTSALEIYYRLKKVGNFYTAYYSLDGESYVEMGTYEADFAEPKVALAAFNGRSFTDDLVATFEYLTYSELPDEVAISYADCTPIGRASFGNGCIEWITTVGSGFSFTYNNETDDYLQAEVGINYSSHVGGDTVSILSEEISTFTTTGLGNWSTYQDFNSIGYVTLKPGLNTITFRSEYINGTQNIGYNVTEIRLSNFEKLSDVEFDRTAYFGTDDFHVFGNAVMEPTNGPYTNVGYMQVSGSGKETGFCFTYTNCSDEPVYATVGAKLTTNYGSNTCTAYAITANGEEPLYGSTYAPPNYGTWDVSRYTVVNGLGTVLLQPGENTIYITAITDSNYGMNVSEVYLQMNPQTDHVCGPNLTHYDAAEPGCHYDGNIEFWKCSDCETIWLDMNYTKADNTFAVILPALGSKNLTYVKAKAPSLTEDGNIEYWYCPDCEQYWLDEQLTMLTNAEYVILPKMTSYPAVSLTLTGNAEASVNDEVLTYTVSAKDMYDLATAVIAIQVNKEYLTDPVAEACDGWTVVAQSLKNDVLYVCLANFDGANGNGDIMTIQAKPTGTAGSATVSVVSATLSAYTSDSETYVETVLDNASFTTTVKFNRYDVNKDGVVDQLDLTRAQRWFGTNNADADINEDGIVDINDLILILNNYHELFE